MTPAPLTPEEYEAHLKDLKERLELHFNSGEGKIADLLKDAERVLECAGDYPEVFARYQQVEGLVAEMLARRRQDQFLQQQGDVAKPPGCLLGWLAPRARSR